MRDHVFDSHTEKAHRCGAGCEVCEGGLRRCVVCWAQEGALTSECPGEATSLEQNDLVWKGKLDYCRGEWTTETVSPYSPAAHR